MPDTNVIRLFGEPAAVVQGDANAKFEECWRLWPKKAGKVVARQKFLAITKGAFNTRTLDKDSGQYVEIELSATPEQVLAGVKAYLASQVDKRTYRLRDDGKYIPHLATFLNSGKFMDLLE